MPLIVIPQILLCGLFVPRDQLPDVLGAISDLLPLSYAVDAMTTLTTTTATADVWRDLAVVAAYALGALALGRGHPPEADAVEIGGVRPRVVT